MSSAKAVPGLLYDGFRFQIKQNLQYRGFSLKYFF